MPKLPLPLNIPLKVRGMKGVISIISITPLAPLILRGEFLGKLMNHGAQVGKPV